MKLAVIILALAITGCASTTKLYRAGATEADRENDYDQCNYDAMKSTPNSGTLSGTVREIELINMCMKLKGWRVVPR